MANCLFLSALFSLIYVPFLFAQQQKIESLLADSDLDNAQVYAVAKDRKGFLWFGTAGGVKRYDGYNFTTFRHSKDQVSSLSNDNVSVMMIDSQDRLWIGTWGGGVNLYQRDSQSFKHFRHDPIKSDTVGADKIQALYEGRDGSIWVGTNGGGLSLYNDKTGNFQRYAHDAEDPDSIEHNRIWSIAEDSQGTIWSATSNGLYRLDSTQQRFRKFDVANSGEDGPEVRALHIDKNDNLWMATRLSFGRLNIADNSYTPFSFPEDEPSSITRMTAHKGGLLLATFAGIYHFDLASSQFVPTTHDGKWALLGNRDVRQVLVDSTGLLWAATRYSGVFKVYQEALSFFGWKNYLQNEKLTGLFGQVMSMSERADGQIWLGTGRGLVTFDGDNTFTPQFSQESLDRLDRLRVQSIAQTKSDAIYIGTDAGVFYLESPDGELEPVVMDWLQESGQAIDSLTLDHQERLWLVFSSARNVTRWDPATNKVKHYLNDIDPAFTFVDQQGYVWVGTSGEGVFRIIPDDIQLENKPRIQQFLPSVDEKNALSDAYLNDVIQTDNDTLWFATDGGVDRYSKSNQSFTNYNIDTDGIKVSVKSMATGRNGMLWLATSHGVFRLGPQSGVFHHFTVNDGLNSNSFLPRSIVSASSGHIYLGSIDGVTGFFSSGVNVNTVPPPVAITDVKIDGKSQVPLSKSLQLPSSHKSIDINFSALDFQASEDNQYRTRMLGLNDEWSERTSRSMVSYARLLPDTYTFEVIGSNNHGIWNKIGARLTITVLPVWYQTTVFKVVLPLTIFLLVLGIYLIRVRQHKATEKFLSVQIEQRTQDIFVLGNVGKDIAATFDIDDICQKIYQRLNSTLNADTFVFGLYHPKCEKLEFIFTMYKGERQPSLTVNIDTSKPASWSVVNQKEFIAMEQKHWDAYAIPRTNAIDGLDAQTVICQPLMVGNNVLGVLLVQNDGFNAFERSQINILRVVASHTAIALSNSLSFRELEKTEARLELAMSGANAGTWEWNVQSNELITNEIWSSMLGYEREEFDNEFRNDFSRTIALIHPDERQITIDAMQRHLSHQSEIYRAEYRMKSASGDWKWLLSVGKAAVDPNDPSTQRIFGIHLDISESKHMEQTLKEAKDTAEAATKAKSDFLSNMSHEIRTPMNAIIGMSYLALETELDGKQRNYIEKVHRSAESLLGIINDILDFSKIEAGKLDIEQIEFLLEDVLHNLADSISLKAEEKGIELYFDFDPSVPNGLIGDPLRLGQILLNLGNNAVKFTEPEGEILVSMLALTDDDDGVMLQFSVKDNGIGMSAEQESKLFKSFSQADMSITRKYGGTGLGLAISKTLAELMHGDIWVESKLGEGSTFHFTVRLRKQLQQIIDDKNRTLALEKIKILLVDDSALSLEILSSQLASLGFKSDQVNSGTLALEAIEKEDSNMPYEIVFMDWNMPDMNGVTSIEAIRANKQLRHQPKVIMITAHNHDEIDHAMAVLDVIYTLPKPITPSTLFEALSFTIGMDPHKYCITDERENSNEHVKDKLRGANVLLVEDNDMNQELAMELLRNAEINVTLAENGQEALNALAEREFDGVLMDCQMPVMDGYTATKEIRLNEKYSHLPIIAMTANAMAGERERVLSVGMNDHIAKPINVNAMFTTMAKWIVPSHSVVIGTLSPTTDETLESPDLLFQIDGVDTVAGLATAAGNIVLYKRLLSRFKIGQTSFVEQFASALDDSDKLAAERAAHTLRGAAANIGAKSLASAAEVLEQQCQANTADYTDALNTVEIELKQVISNLNILEEKQDSVQEKNVKSSIALDVTKAQELLSSLIVLLQDYDIDAADILDELTSMTVEPIHLLLLKQSRLALDDYDFDSAVAAIEKFQQELTKH